MTDTPMKVGSLFDVRAEVRIAAPPDEVYATVSDLPRCGAWSEECNGGEWISGAPATVGAVFRGENHRSPDVVAWAPVVRGDWTTEAEVVAAVPGRRFGWAMRDRAGRRQQSLWTYEIEAAPPDGEQPAGSLLVHHFWMGRATEGIRGITAAMSEAEKKEFFSAWAAKLETEMAATVRRLKGVIEKV
ncbi:SRPBCC family protein [Streptomyces sp. WMMC500]|uniref:SRPBCC family protein n=1 Tax=Streptomyces sp. WMMC500 TaxID=3015154 RepID=UPI00248AA150|nr:SRPBCC family protein [Streptomyces sp. WMMC500]WBB60971.1 SRPBCC family protein [Streptomyces sp. WMMC500]